MRFLSLEKISAHKFKDNNGQMVCTDCILARTGKQSYTRKEVFGDSIDNPYGEIQLDRPADEVFSDSTMASFENKPVTLEHPSENVNTDNYGKFAVGFVRDIHKGVYIDDDGEQHDVMMGTIVLTNKRAIQLLEDGEENFLSCGYDCDVTTDDNPRQINIRGNHIAMCANPRAGFTQIRDSASNRVLARMSDLPTLMAWINEANKKEITARITCTYSSNLNTTFIGSKHYSLSSEAKKRFKDILNKVRVKDDGKGNAVMYINGADDYAEKYASDLYDFFWHALGNRSNFIFDFKLFED